MVLGTVRQEAEPCEREAKALKTKLAQRGPSSSSPLRFMIARQEAGPCERWPEMLKGELENKSRKPRDLVKTGIVNLLFLRVQ